MFKGSLIEGENHMHSAYNLKGTYRLHEVNKLLKFWRLKNMNAKYTPINSI